jgi:hypothetical protein
MMEEDLDTSKRDRWLAFYAYAKSLIWLFPCFGDRVHAVTVGNQLN